MSSAPATDGDYLCELTPPQSKFYLSTEKYPLFVAGFGSGKSTAMTVSAITDLVNYPGADIACYAPTYDLLKLITIPFLAERLDIAGLAFTFNRTDFIFQVAGLGRIICRSLSNPERIIGYEVFRSHVDELDTLKTEFARNAWNKVIARNRQKIYELDSAGNKILRPDAAAFTDKYVTAPNRVSAYTTPEGYSFAYQRWVKDGGPDYGVYKASTYSNPHLPDGYIDGLLATYPEELISAYLDGEFVNLTSGAVYPQFDRDLNGSVETVKGTEPLNVGLDFNVMKGAAAIFVMRGGNPHCVDQVYNSFDTDETIATLQQRYPDNPITVYPDASGKNRTAANTTKSDIVKLKAAGFRVKVAGSNPRIKDRVASVNALICNGKGERRLFIDLEKCPDIVAGLEQQVYGENGMPDKDSGYDHANDALGYYINREFGLVKPRSKLTVIQGGY